MRYAVLALLIGGIAFGALFFAEDLVTLAAGEEAGAKVSMASLFDGFVTMMAQSMAGFGRSFGI